MAIEQVFVDLDGVLNKFSSYALQYVGAIDYDLDYGDYPENCCSWDIVQSANHLRDPLTPEYTNNTFWEALDRTFWATIPREDYALQLLDYLQWRVGKKNVCIASTATLSPECLAGKMDWIYSRLPRWIHRQYMFGRDKYLLANKNALLIDDNQINCERFTKSKGTSCLVPRPWNYFRGLDAREQVGAFMKEVFGEPLWIR